ncbi:MAG: Rieske (2Fe-2S) protein [Terriglobales bacterium]|jgi:menaquinol-cytochrome c reductase iron-sulfur subunit
MDQSNLQPCGPDASAVADPGKRSFLAALLGIGAATMTAVLALPLMRYVLFPLVAKTTEIQWSDIGPVAELQPGSAPVKRLIQVEQRDGWRKLVSEKAVYVVQDGSGKLRVLSPICPHLGCSVGWQEASNHFVCPCHGGTFAEDGTRISGPPRRSMDTLETKIEDGVLKVHYQYFQQLVPTRQVVS